MIKLINEDTKQVSHITALELSKLIECVLNQMSKYNEMLDMTLPDDEDIRLAVSKGRSELHVIFKSLNALSYDESLNP